MKGKLADPLRLSKLEVNKLTLTNEIYIYITCYFFCILTSINAQEDDDILTDRTLPTPTAFEMTKYGNVLINESSGEISPSIPLYIYKAGRLSLPISLNYIGNGVTVEQLSSWTGINWNLKAGGVITRIVRDRKDEQYGGTDRYFICIDNLSEMDLWNGSDDVMIFK